MTDSNTIGREPFIVVEIDQDSCLETYGRAPCQAFSTGGITRGYLAAFQDALNSFVPFSATLVVGADGATFTQTGVDPILRSPALAINGAVDYIIRLEIERTANRSSGVWQGVVFYTTAGHPETGSFHKTFPEILLADGRKIIELDMRLLTVGGDDWRTNTITGIRFDFDSAGSGAFKIYSVVIGHYASAAEATGERQCFNTRASCQDTANYNLGALTLRFCMAADNAPRDQVLIPTVLGVTSMPAELNIGGGDSSSSPLGTRASVTIRFTDHPYHDRGTDQYWQERDYDPLAAGTFWSKWLARNPYYVGRPLRVLYGYIGQTLAEMKTRHFVIEKINGPTGGQIEITAKDPIKMLDFVRSQAPFPSAGILLTAVDENSTTMRVAVSDLTGDDAYPLTGHAVLGGEVIEFSRVGDDFTITARAQYGTKIGTGKAGDSFQIALIYDRQRVDVAIRNLLETYTDFPSAFIDTAAWDAEVLPWAASVTVSAVITEPTSVAQLIGEIINQTLCNVWWDEIDQQLRLKVLRPRLPQIDAAPATVDDAANIVAGKTSISDVPEDRISEVWVYYNKIDPTGGDDEKNYARVRVKFDGDAESANEYNQVVIKKIFARWLGSGSDAQALVLAIRLLQRYRDTPKLFVFSLDAKDDSIRVADFLGFSHPDYVDLIGQPKPITLQITSVEEVEAGHRNELNGRIVPEMLTGGAFVVATGSPNYSAATDPQKFFGCWIAPDSGTFANGDPAYKVI